MDDMFSVFKSSGRQRGRPNLIARPWESVVLREAVSDRLPAGRICAGTVGGRL